MTKKEIQFDQMYLTLYRIAKMYIPASKMKSGECTEMAYEHIQQEARDGLKGIRRPKTVLFITPSSGPPVGTKKKGKILEQRDRRK